MIVRRLAARRVAEAEKRAQALEQENAGLVLELNGRPSVKQLGSLQRQVDALQRRLQQQHAALAEPAAASRPEQPSKEGRAGVLTQPHADLSAAQSAGQI